MLVRLAAEGMPDLPLLTRKSVKCQPGSTIIGGGDAFVTHAEFFHDAAGSDIFGNSQRNDALQSCAFEAVAKHSFCCLGCESLAPVRFGDRVKDFNFAIVGEAVETTLADELPICLVDEHPRAEAVLLIVVGEELDYLLCLLQGARHAAGQVAHDSGVTVDSLMKQRRIISGERTEEQVSCFEMCSGHVAISGIHIGRSGGRRNPATTTESVRIPFTRPDCGRCGRESG